MYNTFATSLGFSFLFVSSALAQFGPPEGETPAGAETTVRWQVGMEIRAVGGPCAGLFGTVAVPVDWPEQTVLVETEDISQHVARSTYRDQPGGVRQLLISVPLLPTGETAKALVTYEVTRRAILPPDDTTGFTIPSRAPRDVLPYLGSSPSIDFRHRDIRAKAKELSEGKETAWEQTEAIYDFVRQHVQMEKGKISSAVDALKNGKGNEDDMACLFIALCRAEKIPARTVFVPDHCYAEFYLEDGEKEGRWFPCELDGERSFGGIAETRPILQKGENIRVPERKEAERFVAEFLKGKGIRGGGNPDVIFTRRLVDE